MNSAPSTMSTTMISRRRVTRRKNSATVAECSRDPRSPGRSRDGFSALARLSPAQPGVGVGAEAVESAVGDRLAGAGHERADVGHVVQADKSMAQDLAGDEEVAQVRPRARGAGAPLDEGAVIVAVRRAAQG